MTDRFFRRAVAIVAGIGLAATSSSACGDSTPTSTPPSTAPGAAVQWPAALATSIATSSGTWATVPMGRLGKPRDTFWQLFFRPSGGATWSNRVEATATATNGGLVLASAGQSLAVGIRPSSGLRFSPIIATTDAGATWTDGLLDEGLAVHPDALALDAAGHGLAVSDGLSGDEVLASAGSLSKWRELLTLGALRSTKPGKACAARAITAVGYTDSAPAVGVSCSEPGAVGVFLYHGGAWRSVAPTLPPSVAHGTVAVLGMDTEVSRTAVVLGVAGSHGKSLIVAWTASGSSWQASPPLQLTGGEDLVSFGPAPGANVFVLLSVPGGSRRLYVTGAPAASWRRLPSPPPDTATVAAGRAGSIDALGVNDTVLTVWTLAASSSTWAKLQTTHVPVQVG